MSDLIESLETGEIERPLPLSISRLLGKSINRVIVVAGNSELGFLEFEKMNVSERDLVVLINRSIHLPRFRQLPCAKLFFFREFSGTGSHLGLPPNLGNFESLSAESISGEVGLVFTKYGMNEASEALPLMRALRAKGDCISVISEASSLWDDYPRGTEIQPTVPTTGFYVIRIFSAMRAQIANESGTSSFRIVTLGFSSNEIDYFWPGHAWSYEREYLQRLSGEIEAIKISQESTIGATMPLAVRFHAEISRRLGEIGADLEAAIRVVDEPGSCPEAVIRLARKLIAEGEPQLALEIINLSMRIHGKTHRSDFCRCVALMALNERTEARKEIVTLLETLCGERMFDEAVELLEDAENYFEEFYRLLEIKCVILISRGSNEEAFKTASRAAAILPETPDAYQKIAGKFDEFGFGDFSELLFEKLIFDDPENASIYLQQSRYFTNQRKSTQALKSAEVAGKLFPNDPNVRHHLAKLFYDLNRHDEALAEIDDAIVLRPDEFSDYSLRGQILDEIGRLDEAIDNVRYSTELDPKRSWPHFILARLLFKAGEKEPAILEIEKAILISPENQNFQRQKQRMLREM